MISGRGHVAVAFDQDIYKDCARRRDTLGIVVRIFGLRTCIEGLAEILEYSHVRYNDRACRYLTNHLGGLKLAPDQITQEQNTTGS